MNRRAFLQALSGLSIYGLATHARALAEPYRNVLILIELKGGNDGLNTLIPYADPLYRQLRPRLAIPREQVLALSDAAGMHPALAPLMPLWQAGQMAWVQGVGYPHPNLSHFRSIEIWDTASDSDETLDAGWLARLFKTQPPPSAFAAHGVAVGSGELGPLAGGGTRVITLTDTEKFQRQSRLAGSAGAGTKNPALAHILKVEEDIRQAAKGLGSASDGGGSIGSTGGPGERARIRTEFPRGAFGDSLRAAAQVAASPAGVAAIKLSLGSFDTHVNQPATHQRLLGELAEGIAALARALDELGLWQRSLIMTYAEFGRRPAENGSLGTDHGTAAPHLVCGGRVRGGLYGKPPDLAHLDSGNLVHGVDFRSLYASVMRQHWQLDPYPTLGGHFPELALLHT